MTRILLFLAANFAILLILGVVISILGLDRFITAQGLDLGSLFGFCLVFGFGGSFISLWLSKWMAKRSTGTRIIERPSNDKEQWLLDTVQELAAKKNLQTPEVGIFPAPGSNAFATGANRNKALVAVSSGLLQRGRPQEVRAVLAHEIGHVANGDMVTLALLQGVVNTFVLFFSRIIGYTVDRVVFRNEHGPGIGYFLVTIFAQIFLSILASMIVFWFSRFREFRADAAGAELAGAPAMISALERLQDEQRASAPEQRELPDEMVAFGIQHFGKAGRMARLFSTHPPLEERIAALRRNMH